MGITFNQLVDEIRNEPIQNVFTKSIYESHIAEIDGKVALLLYIDGESDVDIVQRTHEFLIPSLLKNHGPDSIEAISTTTRPNSINFYLFEFYKSIEFK